MPLGEGLFSPIAGWRMWLASRLGATAQEQIGLTLESLLVVEDSGTKSRNAILGIFSREEAI